MKVGRRRGVTLALASCLIFICSSDRIFSIKRASWHGSSISESAVSSLHDKLKQIILGCPGETNAKTCSSDVLEGLCLSDAQLAVQQPSIEYTDFFTPWLTLGKFTWTANEYTDFIVWYIFFSGKLFEDKGRDIKSK